MSNIEINKSFMFDPSEHYSKIILQCLDELCLSIPEYFLLNRMGDTGLNGHKEYLMRAALKRVPNFFRRLKLEELELALSHLTEEGFIVKVDAYHLETINRLLTMCKIKYKGLPEIGDYDLTPRGFSVYLYLMKTIFSQDFSSFHKNDPTLMRNRSGHDIGDVVEACAPTIEELIKNSDTVHGVYDDNDIHYCGQWCRRWWKIIPKGYSCKITLLADLSANRKDV
jgi:hypothetical protein